MEALSGRSLKLKDTVDMGRDAGTEPRARSFQAFFLSNHCLTISPGCDVPITNQAFGRRSLINQLSCLRSVGSAGASGLDLTAWVVGEMTVWDP
jgi:hypothetical protein